MPYRTGTVVLNASADPTSVTPGAAVVVSGYVGWDNPRIEYVDTSPAIENISITGTGTFHPMSSTTYTVDATWDVVDYVWNYDSRRWAEVSRTGGRDSQSFPVTVAASGAPPTITNNNAGVQTVIAGSTIYIAGSNFVSGSAMTVTLGGTPIPYTFNGSYGITIYTTVLMAGLSGHWVITTPGGSVTSLYTTNIVNPSPTTASITNFSITPLSISAGQAVTITAGYANAGNGAMNAGTGAWYKHYIPAAGGNWAIRFPLRTFGGGYAGAYDTVGNLISQVTTWFGERNVPHYGTPFSNAGTDHFYGYRCNITWWSSGIGYAIRTIGNGSYTENSYLEVWGSGAGTFDLTLTANDNYTPSGGSWPVGSTDSTPYRVIIAVGTGTDSMGFFPPHQSALQLPVVHLTAQSTNGYYVQTGTDPNTGEAIWEFIGQQYPVYGSTFENFAAGVGTFTDAPTEPMTYTFTVWGDNGASVSQSINVGVTSVSIDPPYAEYGRTTVTAGYQLKWFHGNMVGSADPHVWWSTDGGTLSSSYSTDPYIYLTAGQQPGTYTIWNYAPVDYPVGAKASATYTVIPAPSIQSFYPDASIITVGHAITVHYVYQDGTGRLTYPDSNGNNTTSATSGNTFVTDVINQPGSYGLILTVSNALNQGTATRNTTVMVVAAPVISNFSASTTSPLYGAGVTLYPVFSSGVGAISGIGPVTSGGSYTTPGLTSYTAYTLTVTNAAGDSVSNTLGINPQTPVVANITPANASVLYAGTVAFSAAVTGAVNTTTLWYVDDIQGGNATVGTISASGVYTAPSTPGNHTIKAASAALSSVSKTTTVTVVTPASAALTVNNNNPLYGANVTLTPTYANGTAKLGTYQGGNDISNGPVSGQGISVGPVTTTMTYWLRVTGPLGDIQDASVPVNPKNVVMLPLSPANITRSVSTTTQFSTAVSNAVNPGVNWSCSAGSIDSNGLWLAPATPNANVTITATSKANGSVSVSTSVNVVPMVAVTTFDATPSTIPYGGTSSIHLVFQNAVSAHLSGGTLSQDVTSGQYITTPALKASTTYTFTGTNVANDTITQTLTVTVQPVVLSAITTITPYVVVGRPIAFNATVTQAVNTNVVWYAAGPGGYGSWSGNTWTAASVIGDYLITAIAEADGATSRTFTVHVVAAPTLTPPTMNVLYGQVVLLTPSFTGTGSVDHGIGVVTSGTPFNTPPIIAPTTFTLTATLGADVLHPTAVITPAAVVVAPLTPLSPHITVGHQKQFTSSVTGAVDTSITWSVDGVVGGNATVGTISSTGLYTAPAVAGHHQIEATATCDGTTRQVAAIHAVPEPVATSLNVSTDNPLYGDVVLVSAYYSGAYAYIGTSQGASDITETAYSSVEDGLDHSVAVPSAAIKVPTHIWLRVFDEAGDFVDTSVLVTPQTVTLTPIQPTAAKVSVGYQATFVSYVGGALDTTITWSAADGVFYGATWQSPSIPGDYTITATAVDGQAVATVVAQVVPLPVADRIDAELNPCLYGGVTPLTPFFAYGGGTVDQGVGRVTSGRPFSIETVFEPRTYTLTVQNVAGQIAQTQLVVAPQPVVVSQIMPFEPTRMARSTTRFSASVSGAVDTSITWSASAGSIDANGKWIAPDVAGSVEIFATSNANPNRFASTTVTVTPATVVSLQTNALYPNRLEMYVNDFQGPLMSDTLGSFDPRRDLDIYSAGTLVEPRAFAFDEPNNRYLIYFKEALSYNTLVQAIHHLPPSPFHGIHATDTDPQNVPGFALVAARVDQIDSDSDVVVKALYHVPEGKVPANVPVLILWEVDNAAYVIIDGLGFSTGQQPASGEYEIPSVSLPMTLTLTAYNNQDQVVGTGFDTILV